MMDPASPELTVAPLPEPTPPPWAADGGAEQEEGASTPPEQAQADELTRAEAAEMLAGAIAVPFALIGLARGPHWPLSDAEADSIARPLARALPPAWLTSRILAASPWAVVAVATYQVVAVRLAQDQAIAAAAPPPPQEAPHDTRPGSAASAGNGASSRADGADDPAGIGAVRVANPGEFAGAGLGLPDAVPGRSAGRRAGRRARNAGKAALPPAG